MSGKANTATVGHSFSLAGVCVVGSLVVCVPILCFSSDLWQSLLVESNRLFWSWPSMMSQAEADAGLSTHWDRLNTLFLENLGLPQLPLAISASSTSTSAARFSMLYEIETHSHITPSLLLILADWILLTDTFYTYNFKVGDNIVWCVSCALKFCQFHLYNVSGQLQQ